MSNYFDLLLDVDDRTAQLVVKNRNRKSAMTFRSMSLCLFCSFNFISIFTFYCSVAFLQLIINYYDDDDLPSARRASTGSARFAESDDLLTLSPQRLLCTRSSRLVSTTATLSWLVHRRS